MILAEPNTFSPSLPKTVRFMICASVQGGWNHLIYSKHTYSFLIIMKAWDNFISRGGDENLIYNSLAITLWLPQSLRGKFPCLWVVRFHITHFREGVLVTHLWTASMACFPGRQVEQLPHLLMKISLLCQQKNKSSWGSRKDRTGSAVFCSGHFPQKWRFLNSSSWKMSVQLSQTSRTAQCIQLQSCRTLRAFLAQISAPGDSLNHTLGIHILLWILA